MADKRLLWLRLALRVLISALFLFSAATKLIAIDQFELYVYSFGFLSFNLTSILVRICIAAELFLGLQVAIGWFPRVTRLLLLLMLLFFSLFLCYAALIGRTDSCQCFGQIANLNPIHSLLKNALLILLTLLYYRLRLRHLAPPSPRPWHLWATLALALLSAGSVFAISVPDHWIFGNSAGPYNREALAEAMTPEQPLAPYHIDTGRHLVAFLTPGCRFCQMSQQKIDYIVKRHHLPTDAIIYIRPSDIGSQPFLDITYGLRPLILLLDRGTVVATYHYRNINEREIVALLSAR